MMGAKMGKLDDQLDSDIRKTDVRSDVVKFFYGERYSRNLGPVIELRGQEVVMMGAVNYLGLSHHPLVIKSAIEAIENNGVGGIGSMYSNGCLEIHEELENKIIEFMQKEACAFLNSGYIANL